MEENTDCRSRRASGSDVRRDAGIVRSRGAPGRGAFFPRRAAAARAATSSTDVRPQTPQADPITVARRARRRSARAARVATRTFFAQLGRDSRVLRRLDGHDLADLLDDALAVEQADDEVVVVAGRPHRDDEPLGSAPPSRMASS